MRKYLTMFKNRLAVGMEYRSNIAGTFILDILSLASTVIFWSWVSTRAVASKLNNFITTIPIYIL